MGDRVAVLQDGVLQQCDTPGDLYRNPVNMFVAGFMGSPAMNLFELPIGNDTVSLGGAAIPVPRAVVAECGHQVMVGIRPEHFEVGAGIEMEVDVVEELGSDAYGYGRAAITGGETPICARVDWRRPPARGDRIRLAVEPAHVHFFGPDGRRIG